MLIQGQLNIKLAAKQIREICLYALSHQGRCFEGWKADKIFKFLAWNYLNNGIFIVKDSSGIINGVAVCWTCKAEEVYRREAQNEPQFDWKQIPEGNALMISNIFGNRKAVKNLWQQIISRFPRTNRVFMYRRKAAGKDGSQSLREVSGELLERFLTFNHRKGGVSIASS